MTIIDLDIEDAYEVGEAQPPALLCPAAWPARAAFDIAMGDDPDEVALAHNISIEDFMAILVHPGFKAEVHQHMQEVRAQGGTFKAKAKIQAEEYLEVIDTLVNDPEVGNALRLDAIKSVVKWAGHETPTAGANGPAMPQFNIQINL